MANFNLDDYEPVHVRIKKFYEKYDAGRIIPELISDVNKLDIVVMKATLYDGEIELGAGHAFEEKDLGFVNKTSHLENCETSAIGRALANIGLHGDLRPSREEMLKTQRTPAKQDPRPVQNPGNPNAPRVIQGISPDYVFKFGKHKGKSLAAVGKKDATEYLNWMKGQAQDKGEKPSKMLLELESAVIMLK